MVERPPEQSCGGFDAQFFGVDDDIVMFEIVNVLAEEVFDEFTLIIIRFFYDGGGLIGGDVVIFGVTFAAHFERSDDAGTETFFARQELTGGAANDDGVSVLGDDEEDLAEVFVVT